MRRVVWLTGFIGLALAVTARAQLPDLIMWGDSAQPFVVFESFAADDCAVDEGCVVPGARRLLRFHTETRNIGNADLVLGNPVGNPLFHIHACHGHYHFEGFADYRLKNLEGQVVAAGGKAGFCLLDYERWSPSGDPNPEYDCDFQGIQAGWADIYDADLDCQWIDITDVPDGTYNLELEVNPDLLLEESNYSNNVAVVQVVIVSAPVCSNVQAIACGQTVNGSLTAADCRSQLRGPDYYADRYAFDGLKGQRVAVSFTSGALDAYLYLFGPNTALLTEDDDGGTGTNARIPEDTGYYTLPVDGTYAIEATTFSETDAGSYSLQLICPALPPFTVQQISLTNGAPRITWSSVPGETYQVEFNDVLSVLYLPLPNAQYTAQAGENTLSHTDTTGSTNSPRFYRVRLLQQ